MKHHILTLCSLLAISAVHAVESQVPDATGRWPAAKARQWYDSQPWPCGFNYIPAHAISYTEMWMPHKKNENQDQLYRVVAFTGGLLTIQQPAQS